MWKCTQVQIFGKEFNIIPTPTKRWLEYQSSSREGTNTNFLQNWWSATAHKGGADTCSLLPILFYTCWYFCCMVLSKLTLKKCWVKISQTCLLRYSNILLYTGALLRRDILTEQTIQSKMRISHCAIFWIVLNAGTPILNQNFAFNSAKSEPAHMFEFKDGRNSMNTLSTCGVFNANMLLQWYRILISKNALKMKY